MKPENQHIPVPKTPQEAELSRDDRLRIQTLYYIAGWSVTDLRLQFPHITRRQIDYTLQNRPTPQRHACGRHVKLDTPHRKHLVGWITQSSFHRSIPWAEIPAWLGWNGWCSETAIRTEFKKEGYCRGVRRRKPPLSEANQTARLTWAQWDTILWSDENWMQPGFHRRQWVTRLSGDAELYLHDCVQEKWQRKIGWMFWGCISGKYGRGPGVFWEKEW